MVGVCAGSDPDLLSLRVANNFLLICNIFNYTNSAIKNQRNEHILYIVLHKYNLEPLSWKPIKRQSYDITKIQRIAIYSRNQKWNLPCDKFTVSVAFRGQVFYRYYKE